MKINIEVEVEPEEMRRLIGLPDAQPFWDAINKRIAEGDTEFLAQMLKSMLTETAKSTDVIARFVKNVPFFAREKNQEEKTSTRSTASAESEEKPEPKTRRRAKPRTSS